MKLDPSDAVRDQGGPGLESPTFADELLADQIEIEGRDRLSLGQDCSLQHFLESMPRLKQHPVALDAAIDIALRHQRRLESSAGRSTTIVQCAEMLAEQHPDLADQIRIAAALSLQIGQTSSTDSRDTSPPDLVGLEIGQSIGRQRRRYRGVSLLGRGSSGAVYRGVDQLLSDEGRDAEVAIKVLRAPTEISPSTARLEPSGKDSTRWTISASSGMATSAGRRRHAALLDEARRTRRVQHPNVVGVLDFGLTDEGVPFIVTELVHGIDLGRRVDAQDAFQPREAASIIAQAARGVHAAHEAGVLHCDLKPSNILLDQRGTPRVADFGAGALASPDPEMRRAPLGNVAFAAPEQYLGRAGSLDRAIDVYALGGILHLLLTGQMPNGSTTDEIDRFHREGVGPTLPGRPLDPDLDRIRRRALAREPGERYPTADLLAQDLEAWIAFRPLPSAKVSTGRRVSLFVRRHKRWVSVLVVALVVATGVLVERQLRLAEQQRKTVAEKRKTEEYEKSRALAREAIKKLYKEVSDLDSKNQQASPEQYRETLKPLFRAIREGEDPKPDPPTDESTAAPKPQ